MAYHNNNTGQVMMLAVATIGGTLLSATTIAGLLMVYQIQQSTNLESSAKAIFAADSGIEWGFYDFECHNAYPNDPTPPCRVPPPGDFSQDTGSGLEYVYSFDGDGDYDPKDVLYRLKDFKMGNGAFTYVIASTTEKLISTGSSGVFGRASSRAFELILF